MENTKVFGSRLRSEIRRKGYKTYKEAADAFGVSLSYLNQLMRDEREPSVELLNSICEILEITPNDLFGVKSTGAQDTAPSDRASRILAIQGRINQFSEDQIEDLESVLDQLDRKAGQSQSEKRTK